MRFSLIILLFLVGSQLSAQQTIGLIKANTSNTQPTLQQFLDSLAGIRASINTGGGGESYGVASFNGRLNAVTPLVGDYSSFYAPIAHSNSTANPHSVTKTQVGLSNVDNTSDANKPISTATQTALNAKGDVTTSGTQTLTNKTISGSSNTLSNLNASNLSTGTVPTARLGSGTASGTTYLRGDNTWATIAGGAGAVNSITTIGSSGASTLTDGVLNIPVYAGGTASYTDMVNVQDFGAIPDDGLDDATTLNAAATFARTSSVIKNRNLYAPGGTYDLMSTFHIGDGSGFTNVSLYGAHQSYDPSFKGTVFKKNFDNNVGINIQGVRNSFFKDFTVEGMNTMPESYDRVNYEDNYIKFAVDEFDNGLQSDSLDVDSRYRMDLGIGIDTWTTTRNNGTSGDSRAHWDTSGRFTCNLPGGWLIDNGDGTVRYRATSSGVSFENVSVRKTVLGFGAQVSGGDGNTDFLQFKHIKVKQCKYGLSFCNSQGREINISENSEIDNVWIGVTTGHHGMQNGRFTSSTTTHWSGKSIAFIPNTSVTSPIFREDYAEQQTEIGLIGINSSSAMGVVFDHCQFSFNHEQRGYVPKYILNAHRASFINHCNVQGLALNFASTGTIIVDNSDFNINASFQYDRALHWDDNSGIYSRRMQNHPFSVFGSGRLIFKEGSQSISDRHYGGRAWNLFNEIGNNGYDRYMKLTTSSNFEPGSSGLIGDWMYKSKPDGMYIFNNRSIAGHQEAPLFKGRITTSGPASMYRFMKPGDVITANDNALQVEMMVTKRGTTDGLAHVDDFEAVIWSGLTLYVDTYNEGTGFNATSGSTTVTFGTPQSFKVGQEVYRRDISNGSKSFVGLIASATTNSTTATLQAAAPDTWSSEGFAVKYLDYTVKEYHFDTTAFLNESKPITWWNNDWYDTDATFGTAASASNVITSVSFPSEVLRKLAAETIVHYYTYANGLFNIPTSLVKSAKILSIDEGAGTITLDANSGLTGSVVLFSKWVFK